MIQDMNGMDIIRTASITVDARKYNQQSSIQVSNLTKYKVINKIGKYSTFIELYIFIKKLVLYRYIPIEYIIKYIDINKYIGISFFFLKTNKYTYKINNKNKNFIIPIEILKLVICLDIPVNKSSIGLININKDII